MAWNDQYPLPEDFAPGKGDDKLHVVFRNDILLNEGKSEKEGRPIFDDVDWVKIFIPGDKTSVLDRPASAVDKARFAIQYARYKQGLKEEEQITGTHLKEWPTISRSQTEELKFFNVFTVEQLAEINDAVKVRMGPGITKLQQQARIWLDKAVKTAEVAKASQKIDDQAARIDTLEQTVRALIEERDAALVAAGKKRAVVEPA